MHQCEDCGQNQHVDYVAEEQAYLCDICFDERQMEQEENLRMEEMEQDDFLETMDTLNH